METYTSTFGNYTAADALPEERASFIRKTYLHLAGAVLAFILLETTLILSGAGLPLTQTMLGSNFSWLIVLLIFMGVSVIANKWANSDTSKPLQYMGLALCVVAYTIIFVPLLFLAAIKSNGGEIILQAGIVTVGLFLGLTSVVFLTRKDFSFLAPILSIAGFVSIAYIFAGLLLGFSFGTFFSF